MTLGYIAAFSETLALAVIVANGVPPLAHALVAETEDHLKAAAAWSLVHVSMSTFAYAPPRMTLPRI